MDYSILQNFVRGLGNANAPFGFAPVSPAQGEVDPAYASGMQMIGNIGMGMLASGEKNPMKALGRSYLVAQQQAQQQNRDQYVAAQMLQEADYKKQERAQAEAAKKQRDDYIASLPPAVRVKALSIPGYLEKWVAATDPALQPKESPDLPASIQEYQYARQNGFTGSYADWKNPQAAPKPYIENPLSITKDYEGQSGFKGIKTVAPTIASMVKSLDDPSAMADLDFVYGLAKILDPTSVVRESEGKMVIDSQGIAPSMLGQLNKIATGEQAMLPDVRRKLLGVAMRRAQELKAQADQENTFYSGIAQKNGYDPGTYVQPVPNLPNMPPVRAADIPKDAINELLRDPSPQAMQEFDQVFGAGAAASILKR